MNGVLLALMLPGMAAEDAEPAQAPPVEDDGSVIVQDAARKVPKVAGAAHVVDAETLEQREQDDIHRVLAGVPGVYVRGEDGYGLRPNIGMRGANSDRSAKVTLLEDGIPLAPAPYAAPAAYYFPLTTRLVGVEVFKGPSAIAWGPQTVGGAVNLLTRRVPETSAGGVDLARGDYATFKGHAWGALAGERGGVLVEAAHLSTDGFKRLDGAPDASTGFERQDLMAKGRLSLGGETRHELELKLGYGREVSNETYLGLTLDDLEADPYRRYAASAQDRMAWQHTQESVSWLVARGGTTVRTVAYHAWLDRDWNKLNGVASGADLHDVLLAPQQGQAAAITAVLRGEEDSAGAGQALRIGTNARTFQHGGVQSVLRHWRDGTRVDSLLEVGARLHGEGVGRLHTEASFPVIDGGIGPQDGPLATTLDRRAGALALAGWVRDELGAGPWMLVPGVRVETIRTAEEDLAAAGDGAAPQMRAAVLPGIALSWAGTPWLSTFGGLHRGFSPVAPGASEDARPETAWNGELGVRAFPAGDGGSTYAELTAFGSRYDNLVGQCTLSAGCAEADLDRPFSAGSALVAGVEATVAQDLVLPRGLTLRAEGAWTYTHATFATSFGSEFPQWGDVRAGDALPYVPQQQGSASLSLRGARGAIGGSLTHRGAMRDVAGSGEPGVSERVPAATVADVNAEWGVRGAKVYALVRNAMDTVTVESLRPFGARPGPPRTVIVGVKVAAVPDT